MKKGKAVFNWSGGKDSAHALLRALRSECYDIVALLTTVNRFTSCSTMHCIPLDLLQKQAESIGIPPYVVDLAPQGDMDDYSSAMGQAVEYFKQQGVTHFIFGDIFLHDVRRYREQKLNPLGIEVVEPLWNSTPAEVMDDFLASGLKTVVVTTMANKLGCEAIGCEIDARFVGTLPADVESNGENGEYHTFVMMDPFSAFRFLFDWELLFYKVLTFGTMMELCILIPIGLPTYIYDVCLLFSD